MMTYCVLKSHPVRVPSSYMYLWWLAGSFAGMRLILWDLLAELVHIALYPCRPLSKHPDYRITQERKEKRFFLNNVLTNNSIVKGKEILVIVSALDKLVKWKKGKNREACNRILFSRHRQQATHNHSHRETTRDIRV